MTASIINHNELQYLMHSLDHPEALLNYLPGWMTLERLQSLLNDFRIGLLGELELAELEAVLEIVPALHVLVEAGEIW